MSSRGSDTHAFLPYPKSEKKACVRCGRLKENPCHRKPPAPVVIARGMDALQNSDGRPSTDFEGCTE